MESEARVFQNCPFLVNYNESINVGLPSCYCAQMVIDVCTKYLPSMAVGLSSPKLELCIGDGFEYLKNHKDEFDVIITDSSDPESKLLTL